MILAWIITDQDQVPLLLPPMILIVLYSLPGINIITNKVIRNYDWENFLLLGSSFSLGMLIANNGTANVLAKELISIVSPDQTLVVKILAIAIFVFLIRFLFVVPSSAMIVIFPIHSPTTFYAYETGIFKKSEQYIIGAFSSFVIMFMSIIAALYYW